LELGAIYDPVRNELFTAARGHGAYLNNKRIRVSDVKRLDNALLGTGFPFRDLQHLKPYLATFEALFTRCSGARRAGSAALDLAYVAAGRLDGFWEAVLKPWDIAAGALIIQEAGGIITDFQGEDKFLDNGSVVAGNLRVQKQMLEVIAESLQALN